MNRRLKKALPLLGALVFLMVGAALAVPTFNLHIQNIGEGGPQQITVPGGVANANVNWILDSNPDYVAGVTVSFDQNLDSGTTIYVKVYDSSENLIAQGSQTLNSALNSGTAVEIHFSSSVEIKNMDKVAVVLVGPQQ
ncbi:hypothetical protein [Thermococcus gammatolerans]|uniref:Uncharacterized protein n=1 Tax=Thermococcus gammatolerans (strain DSM 15229 / JCM 11827 / EJ3) TaxID=593117 RepID=C5A2W8_THEGJ|nr:hypothetical protein [Thermococcus gammatolerans]ACS34629.1 Hypothetical protein TGAM_2127 [Thermococcus gammatolerans EJ3]